ncbi:MAG: hypothetical protein AAF004_01000 [Pseudomonadota bacterium]
MGVHGIAHSLWFIVISAITIVTTFYVLISNGLYAALFWMSLPVGALSYLKAKLSPLTVRNGSVVHEP